MLCSSSDTCYLIPITCSAHPSSKLDSNAQSGRPLTTHVFTQVFEVGGDVVAVSLAHGLMRLIAEGAGEGDEAADAELRAQAATAYLQLLSKPKLPNILLKVSGAAMDFH